MNRYRGYLLVLLFVLSQNGLVHAGNTNFYLVDTVNFHQLTPEERTLLEQSLPEIHAAKSDTLRIRLLYQMYSGFNDNDVWVLYLHEMNRLLEQKSIKSDQVEIYHRYKSIYHNDMGYYCALRGDLITAIEHHLNNLRILEIQGDPERLSTALHNIGFIHVKLYEYDQALEYFHKALKIRETIKDKSYLALSLNSIAFVYNQKGERTEALEYYNKSLQINQMLNNRSAIGQNYNNIGAIYDKLGQYDQALYFYRRSLIIRDELHDLRGKATVLHNQGVIYWEQQKLDSALLLASQSMELAKEVDNPELIRNAAKLISDIYLDKKQATKSLEMFKLFIIMRDSINNVNSQKELVRQETRYEYEKQKAIDDQENDKLVILEKQKQKQQFVVLIITFIGGTIVLILLVIIYRRLKITRKQKQIIEERNEEVEAQRDQIELQKNVIERKHEEIQQSIAYAKRIQTAILPPKSAFELHLPESFIFYLPKDVVAGDFYWMETLEEEVFFAVADCTGHGVPGAMVSVVCHSALNRSVREYKLRTPAEILNKTRALVLDTFEKSEEQVKDGMDISLCSWNKKTKQLQFAGANNPLYLLRRTEGEIEVIKGNKEPIGYVQDPTPFTNHEVPVSPGDLIYLFTDGYADQFGGSNGKKMGYKKFRSKLEQIRKVSVKDQESLLRIYYKEWQNKEEQLDDVCVIGVRL